MARIAAGHRARGSDAAIGDPLQGITALVLGAGGGARAAVSALGGAGAARQRVARARARLAHGWRARHSASSRADLLVTQPPSACVPARGSRSSG